MFSIFGNLIKIKAHPKEQYGIRMSYSFPKMKTVNGTFDDLLDEIDVFVFDYIGTAFNEACATAKPIIYFDLGIRNISSDALVLIKERTIYFDIKDGIPTLGEIQEHLLFSEIENMYTKKYSLCGNNKSRAESLYQGIKEI